MEKFFLYLFRRQASTVAILAQRVELGIMLISAASLLGLLAWSTGNASLYAQHYNLLLLLNGVLAIALFVWVGLLAFRLWRQIRKRQFGAKLTARFALCFSLSGILPGVLIYMLSVQFMSRSIESWFNVRVDSALEAGLTLGRAALDTQLDDLQSRVKDMSTELSKTNEEDLARNLTRLRETKGVAEAMVFSSGGRLLAFSSSEFAHSLPDLPPTHVFNQLRVSRTYAAAETREGDENWEDQTNTDLRLRVIVPVRSPDRFTAILGASTEQRWLQVLEPVPDSIARNANQVQQGYRDYQELALSRLGLRKLYGISLTLALILAVFAAVVVAMAVSRWLVRPLLTLAAGTQAVGVGDYRPLPEPPADDEVGQLTRSFNAMTRQLDEARRLVESNRLQLERSNVYLESVLDNLSSGILVFNKAFLVTMVNQGAQTILNVDLRQVKGRPLETIEGALPFAQRIREAFAEYAAVGSERAYWRQQIELEKDHASDNEAKRHVVTLLARGTHLQVDNAASGYLVVFDDISEVISANRAVAWGEVARRLAHEIKNPLTPIQLSAERLAMKLAGRLDEKDEAMLLRSTNTIVSQVGSLKQMVDDFREYARTPPAKKQQVDINALIEDVLILYGWDPQEGMLLDGKHPVHIDVSLDRDIPLIYGDPNQLRQVIHNLVVNACDASSQQDDQAVGKVRVHTKLTRSKSSENAASFAVRLLVADNGPGFSPQVINRILEPYVTTKASGTGLGLAIVKKIIEEHDGHIEVDNQRDGGARVSILLTQSEDPSVAKDARTSVNDNMEKT